MTPEERLWQKVNKDGPLPREDTLAAGKGPCWLWTAGCCPKGYGRVYRDGASRLAYRVIYELEIRRVPDGLELDHLCRNRSCVNPGHLEAVSPRTNKLRGVGAAAQAARRTHCVNGHPFAGHNLRVDPRGYRICRACVYQSGRRRNERERQAS